MPETEPSTLELDLVFALLSESRRRYLLYHFLENDVGNVENLSARIAAWEADSSVREVDEDDRREVAVSLIHNHMPRLADHDVLEYDDRNGDAVTTPTFEKLRPFLEQARAQEGTSTVPDRSQLSVLYSTPPPEPYPPESGEADGEEPASPEDD